MTFQRLYQKLILLVLLAIVPLTLFGEELKGLAVHEKLRVPIYYAATEGYPPENVNDYINNPMPFKMEARYIIDKFSARRNNQLWLNAILASNSREDLKRIEAALIKFSRVIKIDMFKGDRLVFDLNPVHGTKIFINDTLVGDIADLNFQSAIVAIWFGEKQSSKKFAQDIRQSPSSKLLRDFESLKVSNARSNRLQALSVAVAESVSNIKTESSPQPSNTNPSQSAAPKTATANKSQATKKVEKAKPKQSQATPKNSESAAAKKAKAQTNTTQNNNQTSKQTAAEKAKPQTKKPQKSKAAPKQQTKDPVAKKTEPKQAPKQVAKIEPVSIVDQMFASLRNDYKADLKQYIETNAKPVPPRNLRKKPKGNATLRVTVFNHGDGLKVRDFEIVDAGPFNQELIDVMKQSVDRLKSMPPIPEAISDIAVTVDINLDYDKCKKSSSAWICF